MIVNVNDDDIINITMRYTSSITDKRTIYWCDFKIKLKHKYTSNMIAVLKSGVKYSPCPEIISLKENVKMQLNATIMRSASNTIQRGATVAARSFMNDNLDSLTNNLRFTWYKLCFVLTILSIVNRNGF